MCLCVDVFCVDVFCVDVYVLIVEYESIMKSIMNTVSLRNW